METKEATPEAAEMFRVNVKTLDGKVHPVEVAATVRLPSHLLWPAGGAREKIGRVLACDQFFFNFC
jgi:hypothetical protein